MAAKKNACGCGCIESKLGYSKATKDKKKAKKAKYENSHRGKGVGEKDLKGLPLVPISLFHIPEQPEIFYRGRKSRAELARIPKSGRD